MMKLTTSIFLMAVAIASFSSCNKEEEQEKPQPPDPGVTEYTNPVFEPVMADPTVLDNRARDGYFYTYATQDDWGSGQRLVPILRSTDLVSWEDVGNAFRTKPSWSNGGVWAPDIKFHHGKYYLYYSLSIWADPNPGLGVAVSDTPYGPFIDKGKILDSKNSGVPNSIDPYFFTDKDGQSYIFWGSFHGLYGVPMEADGITARLSEKFRFAGNAFEAPYIFIKNGYYYFLGSVGSCCDGSRSSYHVTVARSRSLKGPYLDINGNDIMHANDWGYGENNKSVNALYAGRNNKGPGHNSEIIQDDDGQDWILYHAIEQSNPNLPNGASRRPLFVDKVIWDDNGWPKIGANGTPTEGETDAPVFN